MPCFQDEIKRLIDSLKPYMVESSLADDPGHLAYIEFRNKRGDKVKIYQNLVRAYNKGLFKLSMIQLARYLATHTNLATNSNVEQRIDTIYHFLKVYKNYFTYAA